MQFVPSAAWLGSALGCAGRSRAGAGDGEADCFVPGSRFLFFSSSEQKSVLIQLSVNKRLVILCYSYRSNKRVVQMLIVLLQGCARVFSCCPSLALVFYSSLYLFTSLVVVCNSMNYVTLCYIV